MVSKGSICQEMRRRFSFLEIGAASAAPDHPSLQNSQVRRNPPCKILHLLFLFSLHFFSFLLFSLQGSEFLQISPVSLPKPQSLPLLYWAQLKDEPPAGAPSDETSPVKIQVITTYRKQEVSHELLR